jgi:hypothetical protein
LTGTEIAVNLMDYMLTTPRLAPRRNPSGLTRLVLALFKAQYGL